MSPKVAARDTWMTASSGPGRLSISARSSWGGSSEASPTPHLAAHSMLPLPPAPARGTHLLPVGLSRLGEVPCLGEQVPQLLTDAHGALRVAALGLL